MNLVPRRNWTEELKQVADGIDDLWQDFNRHNFDPKIKHEMDLTEEEQQMIEEHCLSQKTIEDVVA